MDLFDYLIFILFYQNIPCLLLFWKDDNEKQFNIQAKIIIFQWNKHFWLCSFNFLMLRSDVKKRKHKHSKKIQLIIRNVYNWIFNISSLSLIIFIIPYVGKIDLFKKHSHSMGPCEKDFWKQHKTCN